MKYIIKILLLISITTIVFAQDVKEEYTAAEQEEIRKSLEDLKTSNQKANEAAIKSDKSAEAAQKAFKEYDEQQLKKQLEQMQKNFNEISDKADGIEAENQNPIVKNTKDFANAYFEFNPFSILLIVFFGGSILLGVYKFFTKND